jgi:hypothetical protein
MRVVGADTWLATQDPLDFELRATMLELLFQLYVRSASVLEQHQALIGRQEQSSLYYSQSSQAAAAAPVTTVLLKPLLSQTELTRLDGDVLFRRSASVLWSRMEQGPALQLVAQLLLRLHSRRQSDTTSEGKIS